MPSQSFFLVYVGSEIESSEFAHLHRFLHPGSQHESGWKAFVCSEVTPSNHPGFVLLQAKDFAGKGTKNLHLRYSLVASILEYQFQKNPIGFIGPENFL